MRIFCPAMAGSPSFSWFVRELVRAGRAGAPTPEVGRVERLGNLRSLPETCGETKSGCPEAVHTPGPADAGPGVGCYLMILMTLPAPTVRPPSRIAKLRPSSIAIGWMRLTFISVLSPGMTISVPSGSSTTPVTSVVRK
jgi:hypothetical protein